MNARIVPPKASAAVSFEDLQSRLQKPAAGWRRTLFEVIFESDTRAGLLFDLVLIAVILASVLVVVLDSVQALQNRAGRLFDLMEWVFTALFTIEYIARLLCVNRPLRYATSFFGVVDLLALLPTLLVAVAPEFGYLIDVRVLRLLRVFRLFKLSRYSAEYRSLVAALMSSRRKITVFVGFVLLVVLVMGTLMYVIEGPANGFTSIPVAIYWAISTMTTVGFGDLVPKTDVGRAIASVMMLLGWGVLAVPTGIVTAEITRRSNLEAAATAQEAAAANGPAEPDPASPAAPLQTPQTSPRRLTPAARRRALGSHRRSGR